MEYNQYNIKAKVWVYSGMSGWYFITIPKDISDDIKNLFEYRKRGWGSIPVEITLGATSWRTSIFPDKKEGSYLLPLKAEIRKKENIKSEDIVHLLLEIKD